MVLRPQTSDPGPWAPPFRDPPGITIDNSGHYQWVVGFGMRALGSPERPLGRQCRPLNPRSWQARRGHQSVAGVVAFLRTSALPHPVDTLTTSLTPATRPSPKSQFGEPLSRWAIPSDLAWPGQRIWTIGGWLPQASKAEASRTTITARLRPATAASAWELRGRDAAPAGSFGRREHRSAPQPVRLRSPTARAGLGLGWTGWGRDG